MVQRKEPIYLDYAAATPVDGRVMRAMIPYLNKYFANSESPHQLGQKAKQALENSRKVIAATINARPKEIIFTSSATESNNMVLKGIAFANRGNGKHILVSAIEHDCILASTQWLKTQGFEIETIPVDQYGLVDPISIAKLIRKDTILVSVMHANNEIGTIEPVSEIGKFCREKGVCFHTDAAQTLGKLPVDVGKLHVDLLTASSHKLYGPKGAALLFIRRGVNIHPLLHGGGHEFGLRSSTSNVAAIVGFAKAVLLCQKEMRAEGARLMKLRDRLIQGILSSVPNTSLNGHPTLRLPNNVNLSFAFIEGEAMVTELDFAGIAVSTGSACASAKLEPSHVLRACRVKPELIHGSIRISLGRWTKSSDIDKVLLVFPSIVQRLRQVSPFTR